MQGHIDKVMQIVREHMEAAQREQSRACNQPTQPREFRPGDKVLLLLPDATCKFLARWRWGRSTIACRSQVRAFLGLAGYYTRFMPNFSSIASPLSDLNRKGQPDWVHWSWEAEQAFEELKQALTSSPVLRNPDLLSSHFLVVFAMWAGALSC
ncbi:uncharacterized protein LOC128317873 [Pangasianodon hypophthalmus]|uniref:uncharacterized protein LOC128317873 n=1 Tax=Pangasianodon hypophthalmus TaxID=310915 RepID=UPI002307EC21|nr:uncharacterized protein LOC128317873 [Pangasianodon hypophthalmus]